ncbi:MAG: YceI family protein [Bdellovibrionaceae bacterium]|nr:YceI family protein [Pseudobdellovibrionaceae bacterium]
MKYMGLFVASWSALAGAAIDLSKTKNQVEFLAVGQPSALKIRGKLEKDKLSGSCSLENKQLSCTGKIPLDSLDTGISLRNQHMKEKYLETAKYPESTLVVDPIELGISADNPNLEKKGDFKGKLTLHGVTREEKGQYEIKKEAGKLKANFNFEIELEPYKIDIPSYLGIKVSKKVEVKVEIAQ